MPRKMERLRHLTSAIEHFMVQHNGNNVNAGNVREILDLYQQWKEISMNKSLDFSRCVAYCLAELMFKIQFQDSSYVSILLNLIFETDHNFYYILEPDREKFPSLEDFERYDFTCYFLDHVYRQKVLFDGYRMPCVEVFDSCSWQHPIEMASFTSNPFLLHHLLRYGAMLSFDVNYVDPTLRRYRYGLKGLKVLLSTVKSIVEINPDVLIFEDLELNPEVREKYAKLICCCKLLLRDSPQWSPNIPSCYIHRIKLQQQCVTKKNVAVFITVFSANIATYFQNHFTMPMELKQACRLSIRRVLNQNWRLPHGISDLPIPDSLKLYLNLQHD